MAYYPGCSLKQSSSLCDVQSRVVFAELGVNLREIRDWNCCGATSAAKIDDFLAVGMAARNIGIAEDAGFSEMVIPCSACYSRTVTARKRMADDADLAVEINEELARPATGRLRIRSVVEALLNEVQRPDFPGRLQVEFKGLRPVCYYGCMLTRFPADGALAADDVENPRGMETALQELGVPAADWNMKTACCGASAQMTDPALADALMAEILKDALARNANCIVTTCPMCQMNLDFRQDHIGPVHGIDNRLPVYFLTELVGAALGLSPERLQMDRHFLDCVSLLKEAS